MQNIGVVLLAFSLVCFVIAAVQVVDPIWRKLIAAGLAFLIAAELFGGLSALHYIGH